MQNTNTGMKHITLILMLLACSPILHAQIVANPSFEGPPALGMPPPPWQICNESSTPDTQPGFWNVSSPAAEGNTYISMVCRGDSSALANQVEACTQQLASPLEAGQEYHITVELMNSDQFGHLKNDGDWLSYDIPTTLRVSGGNSYCDTQEFIGQIGPVGAFDWVEWEHCFVAQSNMSHITLEADYIPDTTYFGVIFVDNLVITEAPPELDLGPDIVLCGETAIVLDAGEGWFDYQWQGGINSQTFEVTEAGTYWVEVNRCINTFVDTIHVSVEGGFNNMQIEICEGNSYFFDATELTEPGTYEFFLQTENFCDSLVTINLEVLEQLASNIEASICAGQTYFFGQQALTTAGSYIDTLQSVALCDSIVQLDLSFAEVLEAYIDVELCQGQSYIFAGQTITNPGVYVDTLTTQALCDSIATLNLSFAPIPEGSLEVEICQGQSYLFAGQTLSSPGVYVDTLSTATFCDSVATLNLSFAPILESSFEVEICAQQSYFFNGQELNSAGLYFDTLTTGEQCDSLVTLQLSLADFLESEQYIEICPLDSFYAGGEFQSTSGTYSDTIVSVAQCDSIITTELNVTNFDFITNEFDLCEGDSLNLEDRIIRESGIYIDTIMQSPLCPLIQTSNIEFSLCECQLIIPNAFSPNGDGLNDQFKGLAACAPENLSFYVFNRWGEQMFHSQDPHIGWDGNYKGEEMPLGVYVWMLSYDFSTPFGIVSSFEHGNVTLIR